MEYIRLFENFVSDLKSKFEYKIKIIEKYVNYMEKYELDFLHIFYNDDSLGIGNITKNKEGIYYLEYEIYKENYKNTEDVFDPKINSSIFDVLEKKENLYLNNQNTIMNIINPYDLMAIIRNSEPEELTIDEKYFELFDDESSISIINGFNFQDTIFSFSVNFAISFLKHIDTKFNKNSTNQYKIILDKNIEKKYSSILEEYKKSKTAKDFNL